MGTASKTKKGTTPARAVAPAAPDVHHVGHLGSVSEEQLARLFELRPDVVQPAPGSLADVEARCQQPESTFRALMGGDVLVLQLAQVLTLIGQRHVTMSDVRALAGDVADVDLERGMHWLEERHLVVRRPDDEVCVNASLLMIESPAGLGPSVSTLVESLSASDIRFILTTLAHKAQGTRKSDLVAQLLTVVTDPDHVRDLVARAPANVQADVHKMARGSPRVQLPWNATSDPYRRQTSTATVSTVWLMQRGLIFKDSWYTAVMPGEVGLAVRGGRPFPATSYQRPRIVSSAAPTTSPGAEVSRAMAVIEALDRLVDAWSSKPATLLKDGGVGVREVRRLAGVIDASERQTFRLIEMAAATGLIVADVARALAMATTVADEWSDLDAADRWWALALSWLEAPTSLSVAGTADGGSKALPALGYGANYDPDAVGQRRSVFRVICEVPEGHRVEETTVAEVATWDAPMLWNNASRALITMARWTMDEMEMLGVLVDGAPTSLAAALAERDHARVRELLASAAEGSWQLIVQADLTALVSGRAPSFVRGELELLADVEARGAATIYRFNEGSLRRAFDAGRTREQILSFLNEHAAKGVPQPLAYLVGDVERRHGQVRLGSARSYVRVEDPALAAEIVHDKRMAKVALRLIAPTVLTCDQENAIVLAALRSAGYLPVVESPDGAALHVPAARHRAAVPLAGPGASTNSPTPAQYAARAAHRWRDDLATARAETPPRRSHLETLAATLLATATVGAPTPTSTPTSTPTPTPTPTSTPTPTGKLGGAERYALDVDDDSYDDGEMRRPSDIVRTRRDIANVLERASEEEWLVRVSYASTADESSEMTVMVIDVTSSELLAQIAPDWTDHTYELERINWVRVLTLAEEGLWW